MHLGIITITNNRTETHFMDEFREPRRGDNSDFAMKNWRFESATVCFVISLSICYRLFKCGVLRVVCVCVLGVCDIAKKVISRYFGGFLG